MVTMQILSHFNFRHKFSLLVVGSTQSGKTYFVQQISKLNRIVYEEQKSILIFLVLQLMARVAKRRVK